MHTTGIRPYGFGKFDTILDSIIYQQSLDGCEDECGDVSENGIWYGKLLAPLLDLSPDLLRDDHELSQLTEEEIELLTDSVGCIISEDDQGFVCVTYYTDLEDFEESWAGCVLDTDPGEEC